ncbi:glycosyltransferase family 4 protein [Microbulbifer magnicolonia]|uniref:glycosyltransferase family 4 protein n=1 Tax=Microbulbifer magnicolonia TaxID=3109744 RepID=UPI002B405265|nr:glycosyltransferase family 4 protein [Microbulbifer sp. GG15]
MPSKILLISYYYPPDLSAGSFRVKALVDALLEELPDTCSLEIITTQPNRYSDVRRTLPSVEVLFKGRVLVRRVEVRQHEGGMLSQVLGFVKFTRSCKELLGSREFDILIATSSRLATAMLGAHLGKRNAKFCYLDIRDIFTDNLAFVLPFGLRRLGQLFFSCCESWTLKRANGINLVSEGFREYFESRYPRLKFSFFSNGVDGGFYGESTLIDPSVKFSRARTKKRVLYAGNIGVAQGLENIVPKLAARLGPEFELVVIGNGAARAALEAELRRQKVNNVVLLPPVSRAQLYQEYCQSDVLFLHLNDFAPLRRVLPSKLFEYAATGKPIVAGVSGYAAYFVKREVENAAVFSPGDVQSALDAIHNLSLVCVDRTLFIKKFGRQRIMRNLVSDIMSRFRSAGC